MANHNIAQFTRDPWSVPTTAPAGPPLTFMTVDLVRKYVALADAVTRLHEAHDLLTGLRASQYDSYNECVWAEDYMRRCLRDVLAARGVQGGAWLTAAPILCLDAVPPA